MHVVTLRVLIVAGVVAGLAVIGPGVAGQTPGGPGSDVLAQLLTEVRGLRAAMEQMASAGPRVQLALGRLQLQEQRLDSTLRRFEEVQMRLRSAQREHEQSQEQLKLVEEAAKTGAIGDTDRSEFDQMTLHMKMSVTRAASDIQRLQLEETGLAADLATEQARWTDLNQRLEALEGTLNRRTP